MKIKKIFNTCDYLRIVLKSEIYLSIFAIWGTLSTFFFILKLITRSDYPPFLSFVLLFFLQSFPAWFLALILRKNSTDNIFRTFKAFPLNSFDLFRAIVIFVVLVTFVLIIIPLFIISFMEYDLILKICINNNIGIFEYFYTYYLFALLFPFVFSMFVFIFLMLKAACWKWIGNVFSIILLISVLGDFDFLKSPSDADIAKFLLSGSVIFSIKLINIFLFFVLIALCFLAYKVFDKKFIVK